MLTLKTAIGIAVRGEDLEFLCLKRGLRTTLVAERMRLEKHEALPPEEAGRLYRGFLKRQGLKTANAVVSLSRHEALLRVLTLPLEAERNLAKAVEYQVDGLHPFEEGGVYYDFAVLGRDAEAGRLRVVVVMVEKKTADAQYEWFSRAGIAVAGFTVSAAAMFGALASYAKASEARAPGALAQGAILVDFREGGIEVLGFSSSALYSKDVESRAAPSASDLERELALCRAEMRLSAEAQPLFVLTGLRPEARGPRPEQRLSGFEPASIERLLTPPEVAAGPAFDLSEHFSVYAAALAALSSSNAGRAFRVNLLPAEKRVYRSPWTYATTYALAATVALLFLALGARGALQDRLYLNRLNNEIAALEPKVKYVEKLDTQQRKILDRVMTLSALKGETGIKLRALAELTRVLPATVWLQEVEFRDDGITIAGQADSAAALLGTLDGSPFFRSAEFLSSINKNNEGKDLFRIRVRMSRKEAGR